MCGHISQVLTIMETHETSNPIFGGWLRKKSSWLKQWKRRYCLLRGYKLLFFVDSMHTESHSMVDLTESTGIKTIYFNTRKDYAFQLCTRDNTYLLCADSEREKNEWLKRLGNVVVECSSAFSLGNDLYPKALVAEFLDAVGERNLDLVQQLVLMHPNLIDAQVCTLVFKRER